MSLSTQHKEPTPVSNNQVAFVLCLVLSISIIGTAGGVSDCRGDGAALVAVLLAVGLHAVGMCLLGGLLGSGLALHPGLDLAQL